MIFCDEQKQVNFRETDCKCCGTCRHYGVRYGYYGDWDIDCDFFSFWVAPIMVCDKWEKKEWD